MNQKDSIQLKRLKKEEKEIKEEIPKKALEIVLSHYTSKLFDIAFLTKDSIQLLTAFVELAGKKIQAKKTRKEEALIKKIATGTGLQLSDYVGMGVPDLIAMLKNISKLYKVEKKINALEKRSRKKA